MKEMTKKRKKRKQTKKTHMSTDKTIDRSSLSSTLEVGKLDMIPTNMKQSYPCPFPALELKEKEEEQIAIINIDEDFQEVKEIKEIEEDIQEKSTEFTTMKPITTRGFGTTIHHEQHSPRSYFGSSFQNSGNSMMMRHDFVGYFGINHYGNIGYGYDINEQKEEKEEKEPQKRQKNFENNSKYQSKRNIDYYTSNTEKVTSTVNNLNSTENKEEIQMEDLEQQNGELSKQYTQLQQTTQVNQQIGTSYNKKQVKM